MPRLIVPVLGQTTVVGPITLAGEGIMAQLSSGVAAFHAATGHVEYDSVQFSAPPIADALSTCDSPLAVVEHLGVQCQGTATAVHTSLRDTLVVSLGSGGQVFGQLDGKSFRQDLQRGNIGFVPRGMDIEMEYPASSGSLMLFLPDALLPGVMAEMGITGIPAMAAAQNERLRRLISLVDNELRAPGFASELMISGVLRAIASMLVRGNQPVDPGICSRVYMSQAKLHRVIDFIEAGLDQPLSLEDLAKIADLSPFHFSRVFKLTTGETPYHFVCSRRLARPQRLLTDSEMELAELALSCGFASQSHFTAAFSKAFGTSPGRYRRARARS